MATAVDYPPAAPPRALSVAVQKRRLLFAWSGLVFGISFVVLTTIRFGTFTGDTFTMLVGGREVSNHGIPTVDHLTIAGNGRLWIDQQWLAQWFFFRIWASGGNIAIALVAAALTASAFAGLAAILLSRGAHPRRATKWTLLAFAAALPNTAVRAQAFAYLLFIALLWLVLRDASRRHSRAWLCLALPLLVLWANLHGSVLVGIALLVAYCVWEAVTHLRAERRVTYVYSLVALAACASPLATPYGLRILSYYRAVLANPELKLGESYVGTCVLTNRTIDVFGDGKRFPVFEIAKEPGK